MLGIIVNPQKSKVYCFELWQWEWKPLKAKPEYKTWSVTVADKVWITKYVTNQTMKISKILSRKCWVTTSLIIADIKKGMQKLHCLNKSKERPCTSWGWHVLKYDNFNYWNIKGVPDGMHILEIYFLPYLSVCQSDI